MSVVEPPLERGKCLKLKGNKYVLHKKKGERENMSNR